jgi:hypothetical protein
MSRRPCKKCGLNRAERFFVSQRGQTCTDCQTKQRRETARRNHVARTYGLSPEDYARLLEYQNSRCAITKKAMPYNLAVDHDHATGLVRGLLSKAANKLLRDVRDDPEVLRAAIAYLEHPPAAELGIEARGEMTE